MLKDDFVMRQTDTLATALAHLVLHKSGTDYTPTGRAADAAADGLWFSLDQLIRAGNFDQAEDQLYEQSDWGDLRYLELGVAFYVHLNQRSDQELEAGNFTREEVGEGLRDLARKFGVELQM